MYFSMAYMTSNFLKLDFSSKVCFVFRDNDTETIFMTHALFASDGWMCMNYNE